MPRRRSFRVVLAYVLSLAATITLLVTWVVYVVEQGSARRGGFGTDWVVLTIGCVLLALLIGGLTYQLAQALATRRYLLKQEELFSNISHEMKSPLAGIKLHAQTLESGRLGEQQWRRSVAFILSELERMTGLVDELMEASRLAARKRAPVLERIELSGFLTRYFEGVRPRVEAHGVELRVIGQTSAVIRGTEEGLERVLTNLLDNAARFSHRGGEVRCRLEDRPTTVVIQVEDDGIGIPRKELRKVFDRFYQIRRELSDRRQQGTGLGLSIVHGLVREMKGRVRAFSQDGRPGTRFVVELPLEPA